MALPWSKGHYCHNEIHCWRFILCIIDNQISILRWRDNGDHECMNRTLALCSWSDKEIQNQTCRPYYLCRFTTHWCEGSWFVHAVDSVDGEHIRSVQTLHQTVTTSSWVILEHRLIYAWREPAYDCYRLYHNHKISHFLGVVSALLDIGPAPIGEKFLSIYGNIMHN